jgi:rare lipoprotein A
MKNILFVCYEVQQQMPNRTRLEILLLLFVVGITFSACSSAVRFSSAGMSVPRSVASDSRMGNKVSTPKENSSFEATDELFRGMASYYGNEFQGRKTANGERYDKNELSGAHRTLPFGTMVRVRNTANDRSVVIRINDRGPWKESRVLDVSFAAAQELDMTRSGTASVEVTVLK